MRRWDSVGFLRRSSTSFARVTVQSLGRAHTFTGTHQPYCTPSMADAWHTFGTLPYIQQHHCACCYHTTRAMVTKVFLRW